MCRKYHVDPPLRYDGLERLEVAEGIGPGVRSPVNLPNPTTEARQTQRVGVKHLKLVAGRTEAAHNLTRGDARALGQQHAHGSHDARITHARETRPIDRAAVRRTLA
jgi:hypothetical protein